MRPALLAGVCLCLLGLALAAPQLAANGPLIANPAADEPAPSEYGPVQGSYFRAMSYDRYTGTAWERTADAAPLSTLGPPPAVGDRVRVTYEVRAPVRTAPSPWRPTAYDGPEARAVAGSIEPADTYREGDRFAVTARRPAAPPSALQRAGTDYPDGLERYRRLPDDTPAELGAVTDDVTAEADTPYESAVAINRWLRTEKNYSLTVDRPDDALATTFVTEMDAGFCQYFATAMVAMLRAEGVPARYVTGYTPYERAENGTHVIRGKYAHTWVEVYFPDVGWVAFDPTPSEPRREARGVETVGDGAAGAASTAALRASVATETRQETQSEGWRQIDADLDIEGEVTAGANITVTVRDPNDGTPLEGVQVRFNGRPIGETDADGTVTGQVPYRRSLTVAVYMYEGEGEPPPVVGTPAESGALSTDVRDLRYAAPRTEIVGSLERFSDEVLFRATVAEGSLTPAAADAAGDGREAGLRWTPRRATRTATQGGERTFGVNTTIDVNVTPSSGGLGAKQPGEPLTVRATIEGRPVPDATVTAGEQTATTNANGTATIPAPYRRSATVTVRRDDATGEASITVRGELTATAGNASRAGEPVRVTATLEDGTPVEGATVTNGVETATTGADGAATIPAPYEPPWTIAVRRGGYSDNVTVPVETGTGEVALDRPVPGEGRTVQATFGELPIRNASVSIDGDRVGWTDGSGRADVAVPYAESVTLTVQRGRVSAERTVDLRTDATLTTVGPALPGRRITVQATLAGEPLPGATVRRNGRPVGTTNEDGEATFRVPRLSPTVELTVERGAVTASTNLGAVPLVWATALAGLVATVVLVRRRRHPPGTRGGRLPSLGQLRDATADLLDTARRDPTALAEGVRARLRDLRDRFRLLGVRLREAVSDSLDRVRRDPATLVEAVPHRLRAIIRWFLSAFSATMAERDAGASVPTADGDPEGEAVEERSRPAVMPPPPEADASENDVYRAWATFTAGLDCEGESPAVVVDRATSAGFPESAVTDLTETFRAVRYGGAEATPEREQRARDALDRIREAAR